MLWSVRMIWLVTPPRFNNFIRLTHFQISCVRGHKEPLDEADKVLMLNKTQQLLSYDTTFQLGDFYVSPLLFHHTLSIEIPCISTIFLIHEHKFAEIYQLLFQETGLHIPSIKKSRLVWWQKETNHQRRGNGTTESQTSSVQCWNPLIRDIRFWLCKHVVQTLLYTIDDVSQLFHCPSEQVYELHSSLIPRHHSQLYSAAHWKACFSLSNTAELGIGPSGGQGYECS